MPRPGMRWRHVVISTVNSWLPGDPRGFRAEEHKIHSSGDYKDPPPEGEHAGLHEYSKRISGTPVVIPRECRETVGRAMLAKLKQLELQVLALSVSGMHSHALVELPDDLTKIWHVLGQCKTRASHAIRDRLPGRVWAHKGKAKPVDDAAYQRKVYRYVLDQEGAWTWSFKDEQVT